MVVSRMKQPDATRDWPLFCKAALDFYTHQVGGDCVVLRVLLVLMVNSSANILQEVS